MSELSPPRIVCSALWKDGAVIVGPRHFDPTMISVIMARNESEKWRDAEQGFIDQHGNFYTREQAWEIAEKNGQIIRDPEWMAGSLHSEHLY